MINIVPYIIKSELFSKETGICHAFFGSPGGVSEGIYKSLNCGFGSNDDPNAVRENQRRALKAIGKLGGSLATLKQTHSSKTVIVNNLWHPNKQPFADAMVTNIPKIILGVLTADCAPVLFSDNKANIIGAAHVGWRGAKAGIIESVLVSMEKLGAKRKNIRATIGPTISRSSYEVRYDFYRSFLADNKNNDIYFTSFQNNEKFLFDLPTFILAELTSAGVFEIDDINIDTYVANETFFSCRRSNHSGKSDYGRNLSVITILANRVN